MNIAEIVAEYVNLRNQVAEKRKNYQDFEAACKDKMDALELQILQISEETGVDSFKTEAGTAFRTIKTYAKTFDRELVADYAKRTGDFGLYTTHVNKSHVLELMSEGLDPSEFGIDYQEERAIQVRKPTK